METNLKVIIKSGKKNWSGKGFSDLPAKMYNDFDAAISALNSYHFYKYNEKKCEYLPTQKKQKLEFIYLTEVQQERLLLLEKIRF